MTNFPQLLDKYQNIYRMTLLGVKVNSNSKGTISI